MGLSSAKWLHYYYISFIAIIFAIFCIGFFTYTPLDSDKLLLEFESSAAIESFSQQDITKYIEKFGKEDLPQEAMAFLESLHKNSAKINESFPVKEYANYQDHIQQTSDSLLPLISSPKLTSILLVLNTKVNQFKNRATQRQWKRLLRITNRIISKIHLSKAHNPNFFHLKKIRGTYRRVQKEVGRIKKVTLSSGLNSATKKSILLDISSWKKELEMIKNYISHSRIFEERFNKFESSYNLWHKSVAPKMIAQKMSFAERSQDLSKLLILLIVCISLGIYGGFFLYKRIALDTKKHYEQKTIDIIRNYIIPFDGKIPVETSNDTNVELKKIKKYVHKRISYGVIFQEATPFSAMLLDSNLRLIWANNLFYKTWNLQKTQSNELLSWDYLQQFTNLGENDPIQLALKKSLAGIYNIQIRPLSSNESFPYELYISPVHYLGQKRIMLFLYPLRSMEESFDYQIKSTLGPIVKSLDILINNTHNPELIAGLEKDFNIAGIDHIFEKMMFYYGLVVKDKENLMNEIHQLENESIDSCKVLDDIRDAAIEENKNNTGMLSLCSSLKKHIIESVEKRTRTFQIYEKSFYCLKEVLKEQDHFLKVFHHMSDTFKESSMAFAPLLQFKKELKNVEIQINNFKYKFLQTIKAGRHPHTKGPPHFAEYKEKIEHEIKKLDHLLNTLTEVIKRFDLAISKMEMILKKQQLSDTSHFQSLLKELKGHRDSEIAALHQLHEKAEMLENKIAKKVQNFSDKCNLTKERVAHMMEWTDLHRRHKITDTGKGYPVQPIPSLPQETETDSNLSKFQ